MPTALAITHADLAPSHRDSGLGSKTGALLNILCILSGLVCFILCLTAEASRSQVTWVGAKAGDDTKGIRSYDEYCVYSGSGKMPLLCSAIAVVGLAIVMLVQHSFMLITTTNTMPPTFVTWDNTDPKSIRTLTWQAGFFFLSTWACFAVGEMMLLVGLCIESSHLSKWSTPRRSCLVIREGVFTAAGVFALLTVFLAAALYVVASRLRQEWQEQATVSRQIMEAAAAYASHSPPRPPHHPAGTSTHQNLSVQPSPDKLLRASRAA
ncbi:hypothetical protein Dimus_017370 [Dionaea muscipula]